MTIGEFIAKAVERGIAEIKTVGYSPHKERGAVAGMERCLKFVCLEQFEAELLRCAALEAKLRDARPKRGKAREDAVERFWEQRMFTCQVEHLYHLLCAAAHINRWPNYGQLPLYARSGLEYASIVGVKGAVDTPEPHPE
jgi:hypothetical protein